MRSQSQSPPRKLACWRSRLPPAAAGPSEEVWQSATISRLRRMAADGHVEAVLQEIETLDPHFAEAHSEVVFSLIR